MNSVIRHRWCASLGFYFLTLGLLVSAGCGSSSKPKAAEGKVIPKGRILKNGLPLSMSEGATSGPVPPGDPGLQVTFIKLGTADAGMELNARVLAEPPGSFDLIGPEGKGIPPGKYRVAITLAPFGSPDQLKGKYSRERSKIEIEVKDGQDVVIDLKDYP